MGVIGKGSVRFCGGLVGSTWIKLKRPSTPDTNVHVTTDDLPNGDKGKS